jgi:hypothetical protein
MQLNFEQQKNIRASIYTSVICGIMLLSFIFLRWEKKLPIAVTPAPSYMEVDLEPPPAEPKPIEPSPISSINEINGGGGNTNNEVTDDNTSTTTTPIPKAVYMSNNTKSAPLNVPDIFDYPVTIIMPMVGEENRPGKGSNINGSGSGNGTGDGESDGNGNGPGSGRKKTDKSTFIGNAKQAIISALIQVNTNGVGKYIEVSKGGNTNDGIYKDEINQKLREINFDKKKKPYKIRVKFVFKYQ